MFHYFVVIRTLKELGMPLSGIPNYLDRRSLEKFIEFLDRQKGKIEKKISRL